MKQNTPKPMVYSKSSNKKKIYSNQWPQKISNKQPTTVSQATKGKKIIKSQIGRKKEITKIREEINEMETKNAKYQ